MKCIVKSCLSLCCVFSLKLLSMYDSVLMILINNKFYVVNVNRCEIFRHYSVNL